MENFNTSAPDQVAFSTVTNKADNRPYMHSVPFSELTEMMAVHDIRSEKDGLAFSGAQYVHGTTRCNANVIQLNLIVIDVDGGDKTAVVSKCKNLGWRGFVYSTFSHGADANGDRFRLVLLPSRPILPAEWKQVWTTVSECAGADGCDKTTVDLSRVYYAPSCPLEYEDRAFAIVFDGEDPVDIDDLLRLAKTKSLAKKGGSKGSGKEEMSLREIAEEVRANLFNGSLWHYKEVFRQYRSGYWRKLDDRVDVMKNILNHYGSLSAYGVGEVSETLKLLSAEHIDGPDGDHVDAPVAHGLICVTNGTLDPVTGELQPHAPFPRILSTLSIPWVPGAHAPRFLRFLDEIWGKEPDYTDRVSFLQEFMGYILYPSNKFERFLWLTGQGSNGKSVLLKVMANLAGRENTSWVHLDRLSRQAVRATLEGKSLNISTEMNTNSTLADGHIKSITSGEPVDAEPKYKTPYVFIPTIKLVSAGNHLPRLQDTSAGFARRAVIISFNREFSVEERDADLEQTLVDELPGILAFAIGGLKRLLERGYFVPPSSSDNIVKAYRSESCSVSLFNRDHLMPCTKGTATGTLYEEYRVFCTTEGFRPTNSAIFGRRLTELGVATLRKSGGKPIRAARLRLPSDAYGEEEAAQKVAGKDVTRGKGKRPAEEITKAEMFESLDSDCETA